MAQRFDNCVSCPDCGYPGELREDGGLSYQWCVVCCQEISLESRDHLLTFFSSDWLDESSHSVSDWDYPLSWPERLDWPLLD